MRKGKLLGLVLASSMLLVACGSEDNKEETKQVEEEVEEVEQVVEIEEEQEDIEGEVEELEEEIDLGEVGDTLETDRGKLEVKGVKKGINETIENGDFAVTLKDVQFSDFEPKGDYASYFGEEAKGMVVANFEISYKGENKGMINPQLGRVETNTGYQQEADNIYSDDVGGDYWNGVTKSGEVLYIFDSEEDISGVESIKIIINSGYDEVGNVFGDDLEFNVDF